MFGHFVFADLTRKLVECVNNSFSHKIYLYKNPITCKYIFSFSTTVYRTILQRKEVRRLLKKFADEIQAKKDLDAYVEARNERRRAKRKRIREERERENRMK